MGGTSPLAGVDERSQLRLGTLMPTRRFRRSLGTGTSLSFSRQILLEIKLYPDYLPGMICDYFFKPV
jgi:hypothetical protein